jgi:DNA-binding transcriptional ArsR family regulator
MADTILQKTVKATRIVSLDQKSAQALGEALRMRMLEILNHKPMSAEELTQVLENFGHKKAVTTIRHHLDALKTAGLIDTAKMVEVRGAVLKYYSPTVRAFSFELPPGFAASHERLVQDTSVKIRKILHGIRVDKKFSNEFEKINVACPLCKKNHLQEFALAEIVNHALARAIEDYVLETAATEKDTKSPSKK